MAFSSVNGTNTGISTDSLWKGQKWKHYVGPLFSTVCMFCVSPVMGTYPTPCWYTEGINTTGWDIIPAGMVWDTNTLRVRAHHSPQSHPHKRYTFLHHHHHYHMWHCYLMETESSIWGQFIWTSSQHVSVKLSASLAYSTLYHEYMFYRYSEHVSRIPMF